MTPPRERPPVQQQPQQAEQHQILRRPPQATAAIPPLPEAVGERAVNVIQLESKGKEKVEEAEVMLVKKVEIPEVMDVKKTRFKKT